MASEEEPEEAKERTEAQVITIPESIEHDGYAISTTCGNVLIEQITTCGGCTQYMPVAIPFELLDRVIEHMNNERERAKEGK